MQDAARCRLILLHLDADAPAHNWLYEFLEPGDEEIIAAYVTLNGPEPHESDAGESSSSSSDEESDDADADEGEAGGSMQTE